jgi:hypothetical protein
MMIIECDFHPSWQQVSWLDTESGDRYVRKQKKLMWQRGRA